MAKGTEPACIIFHNPRCSKSRAALSLLTEQGIEPKVVEYLKLPPTAKELTALLSKLGLRPDELLRKGEPEYESKVAGRALDDAELVRVMVDNPILIERPIVVVGGRAVIGRPAERVLPLLKK